FAFSSLSFSKRRARRHLCATWISRINPSRRAVRNNLDGDSFRFRARLVADVMYVSAAYVSEALADTVGRGRAIVLVNRDRSFCHCDQTGTGMGVPPTLAPGLRSEEHTSELQSPYDL